MHVVVYSKDPTFLGAVARQIEGCGHTVTQGANLGEVLTAVSANKPDAVVLGGDLPVQDAVLAGASVRTSFRKARIMAIIQGDGERASMLREVGVTELVQEGTPATVIAESLDKPPTTTPDLTTFGKVGGGELGTLESLFKDQPENVEGQWLLGFAYYRAGEFQNARPLLENVVRRDPKRAQARYYLGSCYFRLDRAADAIAAWNQVCEMAPGSLHAKKAKQHIKKAEKSMMPAMTMPPSRI